NNRKNESRRKGRNEPSRRTQSRANGLATRAPGGSCLHFAAFGLRLRRPGDCSMPNYTWDHIHLRSPDPEATAAWFERMLGAQVIRTMQEGKPRIDLKLGGADVFIMPVGASDNVNAPPVTPYQGLDHFGLAVRDVDAVAAELKAKGAEFTMEP